MPSQSAVSIVIPTLDGGDAFRITLEMIRRQDLRPEPELVIVDSGSSDATCELARAAGARILTIDPVEFNHGRARNLGIEASSGEIIALLSQDAEPADERWLSALVSPFTDPTVAGAYSRQLPRPDCSALLKDRLETWAAGRNKRVVQRIASTDEYESLTPMERLGRCAFDDVSSSLRRSVWRRYPFEERAFGEDVAWARSVLLAGYAIVFEPASTVIHSHELSMWYEFRRIYADHANLMELFELQTIPTLGALWRAWHHQRRHYREVLGRLDLPLWRHLRARLHSIPYALLENLAQYLGARSPRELNAGSGFFRWLDRRLRRSV